MSPSDSVSDNPSGPVFGPPVHSEELENPLGKMIRIRLYFDRCKNLPVNMMKKRPKIRGHVCRWHLDYWWGNYSNNGVTSPVYESHGLHRRTVQWDEVHYIDCPELSTVYIKLNLSSADAGSSKFQYHQHVALCTCIPVKLLCEKSELTFWTYALDDNNCTLTYSASQVLESRGEQIISRSDGPPAAGIRCNSVYSAPMTYHLALWNAVLRRLSPFMATIDLMKMASHHSWSIQYYIFGAYERCKEEKLYDLRTHGLLTTMRTALDIILQPPVTHIQHRRKEMKYIMHQLDELVLWIYFGHKPFSYNTYRESELMRLIVIINTPDPIIGASGTSAHTECRNISRTIAKDTFLLTLEAIVQSSDAFPPLKSAASGLLFFATSADMASSNKGHIREIQKRIKDLAAVLRRGTPEGSMLTLAHQEAITALAAEIDALKEELQAIITERKSRLKRFFSAKRHRDKLQEVVWQLGNSRDNYTATIATLNATNIAQVLSHVQAMTLVMNASPVPLSGSCRPDAMAFLSSADRFEEV